jgi:hypothetical protein
LTLAHVAFLSDVAATRPGFLGAALAVGRTVAKIARCGVAACLSARSMRTVDALEGGAAAAAILTVRSISGAFGAGFAGFAILTVIG